MDHYIDIKIRPDPEFPPEQLMNALFAKLHRALAKLGSEGIGISFPEVNPDRNVLGRRLRLHGAQPAMSSLMASEWLFGMRDHVQYGTLAHIPDRVMHRAVRRIQAKSSPERLRRRYMRRHNASQEAAQAHIPDSIARTLALPSLELRSRTTGQAFRLFISHGPLQSESITGKFNAYGLSQSATVPWF